MNLKQKTPLVRKAPMTRTTSIAKAPKPPKLKNASIGTKKAAPAPRAKLKTKQRAVTALEKALWSELAEIGCIACMKDGIYEPDVSIHHIDGRTKPDCHKLVLPLCASHHQEGTGKNPHYIAVHPWKNRFEARFGTQQELLAQCFEFIRYEAAV
jgi:hypothetical protein